MSVVTLRCADNVELATTASTLSRAPKLAAIAPQWEARLVSLLVDSLRRERLLVPSGFSDWAQLSAAARSAGMTSLADAATPATISISCHAALSTGRLNPEVTFRKVVRIVVQGKLCVVRAVFGDQLNESRDGGEDAHIDRYTARCFLKHVVMERAFDALAAHGFRLSGHCTFSPSFVAAHAADEAQFLHHSQYAFTRS